jgi:hypothetical protein
MSKCKYLFIIAIIIFLCLYSSPERYAATLASAANVSGADKNTFSQSKRCVNGIASVIPYQGGLKHVCKENFDLFVDPDKKFESLPGSTSFKY